MQGSGSLKNLLVDSGFWYFDFDNEKEVDNYLVELNRERNKKFQTLLVLIRN